MSVNRYIPPCSEKKIFPFSGMVSIHCVVSHNGYPDAVMEIMHILLLPMVMYLL